MIELSIDQITRVATDFRRKPIVEIRRKWPEVMPAKVRFSENGLVAPLAAGAVVTWVLKRKTDGLVLSTPAAATLVGTGAASFYETLFYFSTDALNPLFANAELQRLECVIEVRWEQTGEGTDQRSITIPAIVERAENPGDLINAQNVTGYPSAQVILDHIADDENPHAVTAAQVGAPTVAASESYTDAAEAAAISAAATDATTKANAAEAAAIQRANHTGTQAISTVSGLQTALDTKPPNTRTITAAGLATGGGDLSANRTITVSESGDTAIVDETELTTVISPRKWWQRLNFWIADTAAKTLGGNLTINGVDARLPNGGATFPTPESICTQARGDGRYIEIQDLIFGKITPFSLAADYWTYALTGAGATAGNNTAPGLTLNVTQSEIGSVNARVTVASQHLLFFQAASNSAIWTLLPSTISATISITAFSTPSGDSSVARFYIAKSPQDSTADLNDSGYGVRLTKNGTGFDLQAQCHNGTSLVTSDVFASVNTFNLALRYDGAGTLTVLVNGAAVGSLAGGPTGNLGSVMPRFGLVSDGSGTGATSLRTGPVMMITYDA